MAVTLPWVLAALAALAVAELVVPRHVPRRFPEDEDLSVPVRRRPRSLAGLPRSGRHPDRWRLRRPGGRERAGAVRSHDGPSDLATCCDLLAVAAASGATVAGSIAAVGAVGRGPVGSQLARAARDLERGVGVLAALDDLQAALGSGGQALVATLRTAVSSGAPPAPALQRLADAERRRARRRVEARVRRLPVLLLLPLVGCILPAFVLLTLVPVGLSAARGAGLAAPPPGPSPAAPAPAALPPHPSTSGGPP